jgi:hypothetical protein
MFWFTGLEGRYGGQFTGFSLTESAEAGEGGRLSVNPVTRTTALTMRFENFRWTMPLLTPGTTRPYPPRFAPSA